MYISHIGDNIYCKKEGSIEAIAHALVFDLTGSTSVEDDIFELSNSNQILYIASIRNNVGVAGAGSFVLNYIKDTGAFIYLESPLEARGFFEKSGFINYRDNIFVYNAYKNGKPLVKDGLDIYHIKEITENTLKYTHKLENKVDVLESIEVDETVKRLHTDNDISL